MSLIKSISGIRGTIGGKVGENLTPIDIIELTSAFVAFLRQGTEAARAKAAQTLAAVKQAMRINYFDPGVLEDLIREQSEKYGK